ncbi:hypothetical protein Taro_028353 [Colocasia esculenta]|uniref:Uncharacterized protein n=1 Tax=Colocasia esculenta TaxID=4460 RepID=A0A843VMW8_COLES|nr:hypothetical protein [Colocasia esculenta]
MASTFVRSVNRRSLSSLHSCVKPRAAPAAPAAPSRASVPAGSTSEATHFSRSSNPSVPARRFPSSSRCPSELGCCWGSLFPLHSAVAAARLNSCLSSTSCSFTSLSQGMLCR